MFKNSVDNLYFLWEPDCGSHNSLYLNIPKQFVMRYIHFLYVTIIFGERYFPI
jgi:hypothetical protein